jgi:DNA repair photolyase
MKKEIFGTREWAQTSVDIQNGCPNNCRYCYARAEAVRWGRPWDNSVSDSVHSVNSVKISRLASSRKKLRIMFPAHHDITKQNVKECYVAILSLVKAGHQVLIVSKPDPEVIDMLLCTLPRENIEFRFTIGSACNAMLHYWEPNAPRLGARLESLISAWQAGFRTSVSIEPMLDSVPERVVELVAPFVTETIWIGLPNFLAQRLAINGEAAHVRKMGKDLMDLFTDDVIHRIHQNLVTNPKIRWKESMKKRLGLPLETKSPGMKERRHRTQETANAA